MKEIIKSIIPKLKFEFPYEIDDYSENLYMENYHKHTYYSNVKQIDCATSIESYIKKTKEYNYQCLFSGEHGWQGQYLNVYKLCETNKLKFRYSTEAYWVKDRLEKDNKNCHIVLVAKNHDGLEELNYILSIANEDGYYYKPRIDLELLFSLNPNNVIVTSSCIAGWKYDNAEEIWLKLANHFKNNFFLEVQYHNTNAQKQLNKKILDLSNKYGIQLIAGLDTHYIEYENKVKRDKLLERKNIFYDDEQGWHMDFPNGEETFRRFLEQGILSKEEILTSIMNTCVFINECENIVFDKSFKIPNLYKDLSYDERCDYLKELLLSKYEEESFKSDEKLEGIKYEFNEIKESKVADYFLTNERIINTAVKEFGGVLTTTGRGSASSYVMNKLLGFTTVDRFTAEIPMYPERFLTKSRIINSHQMPDVDFNMAEQDPFVEATRKLLGEHSCYPLLAFGTLKEKSAWKLYAGVNNITPTISDEISKSIDKYNEKIKYCETEEEKEEIDILDYIPEQYLDIYITSKEYQGIIENAKGHACGHLILDDDIRKKVGIIRCVSETTGKSILTTVIDGSVLDEFGYVKNDYLIVDVVSLIDKFFKRIGKEVPTFDELKELVKNDKKTWDIYANGITVCINQCEKTGTTNKAMKYKMQTIEELSAFIAGIRPAFKSLINNFIDRKPYTTSEEKIDKLLESSYHYLLYQESIMLVLKFLGVDMQQSYDIIKAISKKKLKGKKKDDLDKQLQLSWLNIFGNLDNYNKVWKVIEDSSAYAFNSVHAYSMAGDSLYCAYFKAHYTSEFYEVALNHYMNKGKKDKVKSLMDEAEIHFGYKIGTFEYGKDNSKFTIDDEKKIIYPNLSSIKGIGEKVTEDLYNFYNKGYKDIQSIYSNIKGSSVNKTVLSNLIKIGYFKNLGKSNYLLKVIDILEEFSDAKTLSKDKLVNHPLGLDFFSKYGRCTEKKIMDLESDKLIQDLINNIEVQDDKISDIIKNQVEILNGIYYTDSSFRDDIVAVQEIVTNKWGTTFLTLYRIQDGSTAVPIKVDKQYYNFNSLSVGDIIQVDYIVEKPKKRKIDGKFVELEETEMILTAYHKLKEL